MRSALVALLFALPWLAVSCVTSENVKYFKSPKMDAVRTAPSRAWRITDGEGPIGFVVMFRSEENEEQLWFTVRNEWNQDLGMVDSLGRAWRFRPYGEEAEWLGTGTVADGTGQILRLEASPHLEEIELDTLPRTEP